MEAVRLALPMLGCAVVMVVMMRIMGMGGHRQQPGAGPDPADQRQIELEAEAAELRSQLAENGEGMP